MQTAYTILILLLVMGGSRVLSQAISLPLLPLPLLQIVVGALLALPGLGLHVALDPDLFLFLFIPPLLFSDGWRIPKRALWELRWPILQQAFGLVLFTVLGAGVFIHWVVPGVPWAAAFALAAVLSPTDAVAVSAIARDRLPLKQMHVLQGEALLNDASGLVTFKFAVAAALTGVFSLAEASVSFVWVAVGGALIGTLLSLAVGWIRARMIQRGWEDPATHVVLMLLLPFAAYLTAERCELSGILAAVAAGMTQSRSDLLPRQTATRLVNRSVWGLLEFVFNGLIFLLLGLQLPDIFHAALAQSGRGWAGGAQLCLEVLAIFAVLMLLRFAWIIGMYRVNRWIGALTGELSLRTALVTTVSGVRGAVTLAGILALPLALPDGSAFAERAVLVFIAAGVILCSLVVASIGLPLLLRGQVIERDEAHQMERRETLKATAAAAIRALSTYEPEEPELDAAAAALVAERKAQLMAEYREQLEAYNIDSEQDLLLSAAERRLRLHALRAQRRELYRLRREGQIDDLTLSRVLHEFDIQESMVARQAG